MAMRLTLRGRASTQGGIDAALSEVSAAEALYRHHGFTRLPVETPTLGLIW
ncbi:MAG: hypothetical protein P4L95_21775 [Rouxiella aceris]|uniref:hypothetical protein n=1 Tax=Rouxiella aceris TaxID=2703884 RepID=UPI00284C46E9|nr:hypothetical protein [Rouxiella aceris]MDR3434494.1 hypothetical protein [Rouxiella aceris]